jgi:hypothetical protein
LAGPPLGHGLARPGLAIAVTGRTIVNYAECAVCGGAWLAVGTNTDCAFVDRTQ